MSFAVDTDSGIGSPSKDDLRAALTVAFNTLAVEQFDGSLVLEILKLLELQVNSLTEATASTELLRIVVDGRGMAQPERNVVIVASSIENPGVTTRIVMNDERFHVYLAAMLLSSVIKLKRLPAPPFVESPEDVLEWGLQVLVFTVR